MDIQLKGKRALVTGSSSGLGEAVAKLLAAEGATVIIHGRNKERVQATVADIIHLGGSAEVAIGDLSTDEGADAVAAAALRSGQIDILVNNAGETSHKSWGDATTEDWLSIYNTNVVSYVRMIQRIVPQMKSLGWGRVIHIGGGLAIQPIKEQPHYNATLAARHNLSVSLARTLKETGITSNVVSPGAVINPMVEEWLQNAASKFGWGTDPEEIKYKAVQDLIPNDTGRFGKPNEIAGAVAYLCSRYADYISGSVLRVDGGTIRCL
ncbi:NAD(P)-dependent dehydrogenase (short-subunit alcohol dehydrogenase family) [Mucilaginibacter yixingensis]|uniref:NAD(P)-dependent dehydrogenase (Short-subunit alcohol dehydrogenase family) n=1 Tax=Mucilaginibacter yixingensis TaxID=1295612 RepID=A0A2T5J8Z4_9SPHI|nr:SDR family NAD(P)-dependent oxidoreductase [Mucilaginibacter yixingensis]PTQ96540.1 NAD(P)-dependent dehydrogenase (short-subunit alcohol dehydrogenase family) [Mucilaginibacter yixingensis]